MVASWDSLYSKTISVQNYEVEVGITEFRDLQNVRIKGDNLAAFVTDWDACIFGMQNEPSREIKESLFTDQVRQCKHFEQACELYVTKCTHEGLEKSYDKLREYVPAHLDENNKRSQILLLNNRPTLPMLAKDHPALRKGMQIVKRVIVINSRNLENVRKVMIVHILMTFRAEQLVNAVTQKAAERENDLSLTEVVPLTDVLTIGKALRKEARKVALKVRDAHERLEAVLQGSAARLEMALTFQI